MVYGLCRALLRDPDDADDASQATFVSAYKALLGGADVTDPAAWLATIARNECGARAHARMREPLPLIDADLGHMQGPEAELDRKTAVAALQQAISELPDKQREAVVLRDLYGLRYVEVSAALGMSVASVESLLFRARRSLRVSLKPLVSGALVVPIAVRAGIAQALPGFTTAGAAGGGATSGAVGLGLLAKLTGGPIAAKVAVGIAAVAAAGSVAVVEVEHTVKPPPSRVHAPAQPRVAGSGARPASRPLASGVVVRVRDPSETRAASDGGGTRHGANGHGGRDDRGATVAATRGRTREGPERGRSPNSGRSEDVGGSGVGRVGGDDGAATAAHSGGDGGASGSTESQRGRDSGEGLHDSGSDNSGSDSSGADDPSASGEKPS